MTANDYRAILKKYWGYEDFRGIQLQIIESIGAGKDTLGLMPTGGGKSITFQVPALASDGVCIVISPLIALMKDQVMNLKKRRIKAAAIYTGLSRNEIITTLENCIFGDVTILYVSPERLASPIFLAKLRKMKVSFVTVDEAHCITQWGYDFRPSYLKIAEIRKILPEAPVLALTATATPEVVDDIQDKLGFGEKNVFRMSFERRNLAYVVRKAEDKKAELIHILSSMNGSTIIYVRNRETAKNMARDLEKQGFTATFYHAGLENKEKDDRQKAWQADKIRIMVATNAFGMGIDKPDVRLVVHMECPDSIEAYFQEAGRAGRDGKKAYAVLLYNNSDTRSLDYRINANFPSKDYIKRIYEHLACFYQVAVGSGYDVRFEFNIDKFCHNFKYFPNVVESALSILSQSGYIDYSFSNDQMARIKFLLERDDLYRLHNNPPEEDKVIVALLRLYEGTFVDFAFIDEALIAQQSGLPEADVYEALKSLSRKRILHYIPSRNVPYIRYAQRREDTEHMIIPKEVYDVRKEKYTERVNAMTAYIINDDKCRSRQLLEYFGEKNDNECGLCDVCISKRKNEKTDFQTAMEKIMMMMEDGLPHDKNEIRRKCKGIEQKIIGEALEYLMHEDKIEATETDWHLK